MMKRMKWILLLVGLLLLALPAAAQDDALAGGLNNPRGIAYGPDGTLYIAESGTGGSFTVEGMFGPAQAGSSSQITAVAPDGTTSVVIAGLPSINGGGEVTGAMLARPHDGLLWIVTGAAWPGTPLTRTVMAVDMETLRIVHLIDTFAAEAAQNPDGNDVDSNPVDLAFGADGSLFIADAGANAVWRWSSEAMMAHDMTLEPFAVWNDNPVPTSIALDLEGNVYVGFLTGFPFPEGGSRIEKWSADGELVTTYAGLTTVVDVLWHEGELYATQFAVFGEQGWTPETGSVVRVTSDGPEVLMDGLNLPYGLALTPDAGLVVVVNSAYMPEEGLGAVIPVEM